ncbi:hypothetical protein V6x_54290 [Gimesia chilikensis]|uniref:Uncharacterized protein n=1 Tax=Gimesia chilikensis TaxID=2605989 RepID=A0A517WKA5_9PLAN|nr:hypothetical protein [Gimesia chilikensis]QDU05688.1 hypothetical protein V6x_54290 [Gimesia chilikensis]
MRRLSQLLVLLYLTFGQFTIISLFASEKKELQYQDIKGLANEIIDKELLFFDKPQGFKFINPKKPYYEMADIQDASMDEEDSSNGYIDPLYDQVIIELYRKYLFSKSSDKNFMQPYYLEAEKLVQSKLKLIEQHKGNQEELQKKLKKYSRDNTRAEINVTGIIHRGIVKLGEEKGYTFVGSVSPKKIPRPKKIIMKPGAKLHILPYTRALIAKRSGLKEDDEEFPWQVFFHNDKAALGGVYWLRVEYQGRVGESFQKPIPFSSDKLELPTD